VVDGNLDNPSLDATQTAAAPSDRGEELPAVSEPVPEIRSKTGSMNALVSASDDRILGFTMIGAEADGLLAAMQMAILGNLRYPTVRDAIFAHPTLAEGLGSLYSNVPQEHA